VRLNEDARLSYLDELVARKIAGPEQSTLADNDVAFYQREYERLLAELESAFAASTLREAADGVDVLDDLLVRLRLGDRSS
jgi:hypothetical protein